MHHAYVYEGPLALLPDLAEDAKKRFSFLAEHDPDTHAREFEKFGIDESRWLVDLASFKSSAGRALFIIGISSITSEAQQALLKLLEEPQRGSVFILLVPHGSLLPTVLSRMAPYPARLSGKESESVKKFLAAPYKVRSAEIAKLLKDDEMAKERAREFIGALEAELYKRIENPRHREGLEDIAKVRDYLRDRSPSLKMLLEHLAATLPSE